MSLIFIETLYEKILDRKKNRKDNSYVVSLYEKGTHKIAQKVGEEAVETVIEALRGDQNKLISESADLLFHLLVLWADQGITPQEVVQELERRDGRSGIDEKSSRKNANPN